MAVVLYNGCSLIPGPICGFTDQPIVIGNQRRIGNTYNITINGTIVAWKGSPRVATTATASWGGPNNQFYISSGYPADETILYNNRLFALESKQAAIRTLFANEGQWLEFESPDGSAPLRCQIKNVVVNFAEGTNDPWFQLSRYTITCETDVLYLNGQVYQGLPFPDYIQNASETWDISPNQDAIKTFAINHGVSAVGKRTFNSLGDEVQPAWLAAKSFVCQRLVLGFNGASDYSPLNGSTIFQQSALASGINLSSYNPYNFSRTENIDELAGSYGVNESWTMANASGSDIYSVSTRRIVDDPYTTVVASIQGTIRGFYVDLFDYDRRLQAAEYVWFKLNGPTGLLPRITAFQANSGFSWNVQPKAGAIDYNQQDGSLTYNYEFCNTLYEGDVYEQYTVSRKSSGEDYKSTLGIAGTIKGRKYDGDNSVVGSGSAFNRAELYWDIISSGTVLYERILLSKYFPVVSGFNLQVSPINQSVEFNEAEGLISYSYEFNNRQNDFDQDSNNVEDEYQISRHFAREDPIVVYTVQGTVKGLSITDSNPKRSKYNFASSYFSGYVLPNLYSRVTGYYQTTLSNPFPQVEEIERNPTLGVITYNFQYSSIPQTILSGVLSEHIVINQENIGYTVNIISKIGIIGRNGPIKQDMQASPEQVRSVTIETVVPATGGPNLLACLNLKPDYTSYILPLKPDGSFTEQDSETWDFRAGRYSRQVRWSF